MLMGLFFSSLGSWRLCLSEAERRVWMIIGQVAGYMKHFLHPARRIGIGPWDLRMKQRKQIPWGRCERVKGKTHKF